MRIYKQKYARNKLNDGQVKILELVYKYRFVSRQLLACSLGVNPENGLYEKLEILVKHEFLGKRLEKRLTLQNVPAAYYLTPNGLRYLQGSFGGDHVSDRDFQESYRDQSATSKKFIAHILNIYGQTQALHDQYVGLKVFTAREMSRYTYFPKRLPDAFLSLANDDAEQPHRFFFDIVRDRQPRSELINKLLAYTEFFDDGGWDETESELPVWLLLCEWESSEKSIQRLVRARLSRLDSRFRVYIGTFAGIASDKTAWTDVQDADQPVALDVISVTP